MAYRFKHGDRPIDGYTIQRAVGSGGFGEVYYAVSDGGREVALKYLRDNPQVELRGVSHCMNLKSPHLVSIFDVKKSAEDEYFIVMEYISGPSLRDLLIAEPNGFSTEKAAFFVREIAKGLAYLHDRGIVHRDLKPGNIFYDDGYVKIGDYGLSKFISISRHSAQTSSVGTVHYMAPEIGSGNYSRGVDIYALGVILYEMLLGKVPFEGSSMGEVLMKHLMTQPQVDELPEPFARVIRKALEKDPKDRFQFVDEMVNEILSGETVQRSLAGFSPDSLSEAVRRGTVDRPASPMPSPNPPPRRPWNAPTEETISGLPLPDSIARRMDRISRKIERKVSKLRGKKSKSGTPRSDRKRSKPMTAEVHEPEAEGSKKRILLCALLAIASAFASGIAFGGTYNEEVGASAGMMVLAATASIPLSRGLIRWLDNEAQPNWVQSLVILVCSAPLVFVAAAPMLSHGRYDEAGLAAAIALIIILVLGDWSKEIDYGVVGELSFGTVIWTGFATFLISLPLGGIFGTDPDEGVLVGPVAAAIASFNIQASSWWLRKQIAPLQEKRTRTQTVVDGAPEGLQPNPAHRSPGDTRIVRAVEAWVDSAVESVFKESPAPSPSASHRVVADRVARGGFVRMFWGLFAFMAMTGSIVTLMLAIFEQGMSHESRGGVIIGSVGSFCAMLFALSKTSPTRLVGFWRNLLRPFLTCACLYGVGVFIAMIATQIAPDGFPAFIVGLVMTSLMFFLLMISRMRNRPRRPAEPMASFLKDGGSDYPSAINPNAVNQPVVAQVGQ